MQRFALFIFSVICLVFGYLYSQTGIYVPEMVGVDSVITEFLNEWNVPGASVSISKDGRLVYARGFGYADTSTGELVQPDHRFRIASVSKPITAVAILKLMEEGYLDLNDTVFGLPGILNDSSYANIRDSMVTNITIKNILQHTGGWDRSVSGDPMFNALQIAYMMSVPPPPDPETIIRYMLNQYLDFEPGTQYAYSNFGYCVLGRIIEKLSGENYADYEDSVIFSPIGATSFQLAKNLLQNAAPHEVHYYDYPGAPLRPSVYGTGEMVPYPYGGFNIEAMDSHGGWIVSSIDLLRFVLAVDGFNSRPDILSPATINLMRTGSTVNPGYALGWVVNSQGNWWHDGSLPGTTAFLVRTSVDRMCWAILINTRPYNWGTFNSELDAMMWNAVGTVTTWPTHDLFDSMMVVSHKEILHSEFELFSNYPNPFNAFTHIHYQVHRAGRIQISIYDIFGEKVTTLKNDYQTPGEHVTIWNASGFASGIYLIELKTDIYCERIKTILIK